MPSLKLFAATSLVCAALAMPASAATPAKPKTAATATGATAATDSANWTQEDVRTVCNYRNANNPKHFDRCVKRGAKKIGKPKSPADLQELKTGERPQKAAGAQAGKGRKAGKAGKGGKGARAAAPAGNAAR